MVTAAAGLLTAVAGLLLALQQVGLLGRGTEASLGSSETAVPTQASAPAAAPGVADRAVPGPDPALTPYRVAFPAGSEVALRSARGEGTYRILSAQVEQRSADRLLVTLTVRLTNSGPLDIGFWSDSFRLFVDGVPRAPVNTLIAAVDARGAEEGEVLFDLPVAVASMVLEIDNGEDAATIPLALEAEE